MKILFISYSNNRPGADSGFQRIQQTLNSSNLVDSLEVTYLSRFGDPSLPKSVIPDELCMPPKARLSVFLKKLKFYAYRGLGGKNVHSSATVRTGLLDSIDMSLFDIVVTNWLGDETVSLEELFETTKPVVIFHSDYWYFQGTSHFSAPTFWSGILDKIFYGRESARLIEVKSHLLSKVVASVSPTKSISTLSQDSHLAILPEHWTIPYPLDSEFWGRNRPPKNRTKAGRFTVGFVASGRVDNPRKGFHLLCGALRLLASNPDVGTKLHLRVVGRPTLSARRLAAKSLTQVEFLGALSPEAMSDFYLDIDLLGVPSHEETFGQVILEAASSGVPSVGFLNTPGVTDVIQDHVTGLLAPAKTEASLALTIEETISDRILLEVMGNNARAYAQEAYSPEAVRELWATLLESIKS